MEDVGGVTYISALPEAVREIGNVREWGKILLEVQTRRDTIALAQKAIENAHRKEKDIQETKTYIAERLLEQVDLENEGRYINEALDARFQAFEKALNQDSYGLTSGLKVLDDILGGWQKQRLTVVAAATGMGKTSLLVKFILAAAEEKKTVAFFSLEMGEAEIVDRLISAKARISSHKLSRAELSSADWDRIYSVTSNIADSSLYINDDPFKTVDAITACCRKVKYRKGLDLVVIDYLQLITPDKEYRGFREKEVASIADGLKKMAKSLDVPVIVASQLSRSVENRYGKIPKLSDLRESGAIEQSADQVIFIYRPEYYKADDSEEDVTGVTKLIVAKHRSGKTGEVSVRFEGFCTSFSDL